MGVKQAILEMSLQQKIATVVVAVMIPISVWLGLGATGAQIFTPAALEALAATEVTAVVASVEAIFGVTPPQPTPS